MKKETKFSKFLNKAKELIPELIPIAANLVTGGAVSKVGAILKSKSEKDQKHKDLLIEFDKFKMDFEREMFELEAEDAQNARDNETKRDTSEHSSWLSKNIHEMIAGIVVLGWVVTWYYKPVIDYDDIKGVVTLILGYLYGRTKPQK